MLAEESNFCKIYAIESDLIWSDIVTIVNSDGSIIKCSFDLSTLVYTHECLQKDINNIENEYKLRLNEVYNKNWNSLVEKFIQFRQSCKYHFLNDSYNYSWNHTIEDILFCGDVYIASGHKTFDLNNIKYKCFMCLDVPRHPYFMINKNYGKDKEFIRLDGFTFEKFSLFYDNNKWNPTNEEYQKIYDVIQQNSQLWFDTYKSYGLGLTKKQETDPVVKVIKGVNNARAKLLERKE